jgi:hypothetical protein
VLEKDKVSLAGMSEVMAFISSTPEFGSFKSTCEEVGMILASHKGRFDEALQEFSKMRLNH